MNLFLDTIKPPITETFIKIEIITEAADKLDEFIHSNDNTTFILKSKWSTGKTHHIIRKVLQTYEEDSILMVTENNSLNSK